MSPIRLRLIAPLLAAIALLAVPQVAQAQQVDELAIAPDKDWQHEWTKMAFPAQIADFERERVMQFEERQTNVAASYSDQATQTILTLYIYRPGNPDVSVWFDRTLTAIGAREEAFGGFGSVETDTVKIRNFAPAGTDEKSGLSGVLSVEGNFRSTGVALYRAGEWLVKVRISSRELSVQDLDNALQLTLASLPQLDGVPSSPAYLVSPCSNEIPESEARQLESDMSLALVLAISPSVLGSLTEEEDGNEASPTPQATAMPYCRQGQRAVQFNVYHRENLEQGYYVAIGDSGSGLSVAPDTMAALLSDGSQDAPTYSVTSATGLETVIHAAFEGLPSLQQAAAAFRGAPVGSVNRPLGSENPTININAPPSEE